LPDQRILNLNNMFNMKNAIKPIEVNVDTKNFDVQFVRDKKKGKTYIEIDTDSVDIVYQKNGDVKIFKLDTESDILDIEIKTDKDGTKVDVSSKVNWIGKVVSWFLTRKARRAAKKAKK
tara:strand:+ start:426 stop:782 length:357 start_codon:yes stop_codon:yes gene_type:complete